MEGYTAGFKLDRWYRIHGITGDELDYSFLRVSRLQDDYGPYQGKRESARTSAPGLPSTICLSHSKGGMPDRHQTPIGSELDDSKIGGTDWEVPGRDRRRAKCRIRKRKSLRASNGGDLTMRATAGLMERCTEAGSSPGDTQTGFLSPQARKEKTGAWTRFQWGREAAEVGVIILRVWWVSLQAGEQPGLAGQGGLPG